MKHILQPLSLLLTLCLLFTAGLTRASHLQGGQITYEYIGPGNPYTGSGYVNAPTQRYRVTLFSYRDCGGIALESSYTLNANNFACGGSGATITSTISRVGNTTFGSPYCASQSVTTCTSGTSNRSNYEEGKFQTTIDLPAAPLWRLNVSYSARPYVGNATGQPNMYWEATLNNSVTPAGGTATTITNNSPTFDPNDSPVPFVCYQQSNTIKFSAIDVDGDSLSYSLAPGWTACNTNIAYTTTPIIGTTIVGDTTIPGLGNNIPCVARINPANPFPTTYSPTFPLPSYTLKGPCFNKQIIPGFVFNALTGTMIFTPGYLNTTAREDEGKNKYIVVGKVTEWRKVGGKYVQVGSVRRDMLVTVIDCGTNTLPNPPQTFPVTLFGNVAVRNTSDSTFAQVPACNFNRVILSFSDPNPGQKLTVKTTGTSGSTINFDPNAIKTVLENGAVGEAFISGNGTPNPVVTFLFQPSPVYVNRTYNIPFTIEDDACPAKGVQKRVMVVRVVSGNFAKAVVATNNGLPGATKPTVCPGGSIQLVGNVLRPDSVKGGVQTYRFIWATAPGLNPADVNNPTVTVQPTTTTRYRVRIEPIQGFGQGLCGDTTSIVVTVVPPPTASITASAPSTCSGSPVTLTGLATRSDNLQDVYTYQWTATGTPATSGLTTANSTNRVLTVSPTVTTTYTLSALGSTPNNCQATATFTVTVVPAATVQVVPTNPTICINPAGSSTLNVTATPPAGSPPTSYTYRWTPANGLATADLTKQNVTVNPTVTTTYTVTVTNSIGCTSTGTATVNVAPAIVASFDVTSETPLSPFNGVRGVAGQKFVFTNTSKVGSSAPLVNVATATWYYQRVRDIAGNPVTEAEKQFSTSTASTVTLDLPQTGEYVIRLVVTGKYDNNVTCASSEVKKTAIVPETERANVFTPNGDGKNDTFVLPTANQGHRLQIFNRWGRMVKEYSSYHNEWNGDDQPAGMYYYLITPPGGGTIKGWVQLMR